ncbi:MAG: DUF4252 domain-containing protein [Acidobacteriota bacterium]
MTKAILLLAAALPLAAQEIKLPPSLNRLADKASEVVDVTLDGPMLKLASKFLSKSNPDEVKVKGLVEGLKGIYVKSFEFEKEGEYSPADVEAIRTQLHGPGWSRMVGVISKKDGENADIYVKLDGERVGGLVILAAEPKELTVVNIVGSIDMEQLSELGGHFGIPDVQVQQKKKP